MNGNNGAASTPVPAAAPTAENVKKELARKAKDTIVRKNFIDSEGSLGEPGKIYKWLNVLPKDYQENSKVTGKIRGFEATYLAPVMEAIRKGESKEQIAKIVAMQIERRGLKTKEMEGKAVAKAVAKATRAETPRARTPAKSAAELAEEMEKKVATLKEKAAAEERVAPLRNAILPLSRQLRPNYNSLTAQMQGKVRANALRALEEVGIAATVNNAKRIATTRRAASRAAFAAKKAEAPGVSMANMANGLGVATPAAAAVTKTRRNFKKEITIADFCKQGMSLQAKSAAPLTVSDVLHAMAAERGSTRAKSSSKYTSMKESASKYKVAMNSNDE